MKREVSPVIGMVLGFILIVWAIVSSGDIINFIDIPSVIITLFGSFCAILIIFPFKTIKNIPKTLKALVLAPKDSKDEIIVLFVKMAKKARVNGLLSLEDDLTYVDNEMISLGMQMVIDGMELENIREILRLKLDTVERRHNEGQAVFEKWGELAPAFGMLGTLVGLIIMLSGLDDPSNIGAGMATALLTTFYGSLLSNLVFLPIAEKLSYRTEEEVFVGNMVIEGVTEIQSGTNPRILEERLVNYLSPVDKEDYTEVSNLDTKEQAYE